MKIDLLCVMIFISGMWVFSSKRKHLLITLLSLEFMVLSVFVLFFNSLPMNMLFYSLIYLTFTACEAALGLTILISMSRTYGTDYFSSFNMNY